MTGFAFDASSLREWLAAAGLLRLVSETTKNGRLQWCLQRGRYRLRAYDLPGDLTRRCFDWIQEHRSAWSFAGKDDVDFDIAFWREHASRAKGIEASLWCAVASDGVRENSRERLQASSLEYAHGVGHQHWLKSLRAFVEGVTVEDFARILAGERNERMKGPICRWDPACERNHAYRAKAPADEKQTQDQAINALAAIGFSLCPSAPGRSGPVTPLVYSSDVLRWPIWTDALRVADLEAALCCGWSWPTMEARRWKSGKFYCFSRGELRETQPT